MTTTHTTEQAEPTQGRIDELVRRAQQGDRSVLPQIRAFLDADPDVWKKHGDLAQHARAAWLRIVADKDLILHECVERKLGEMRAELAGPSPSPLAELLVERILACWVQVMHADFAAGQVRDQQTTPAVRQELLKRQESAQKRYLASIKQLGAVRKLLRPGLSPFDLAMRPVEESNPTVRGRATAAPPVRVSALN
jgi:hypothetical protein